MIETIALTTIEESDATTHSAAVSSPLLLVTGPRMSEEKNSMQPFPPIFSTNRLLLHFAPLQVHFPEAFWRAVSEEKMARIRGKNRAFADEPIRLYLPLRTTTDSTTLPSNVAYALRSSLILTDPAPSEPCRVVPGSLVQFATLRELEEMNMLDHSTKLAQAMQEGFTADNWSLPTLLRIAVFCFADLDLCKFYYRAVFPSPRFIDDDVVLRRKVSVEEYFAQKPTALCEIRSFIVSARDSAADMSAFVVAPDPLRPGSIVVKPFSPCTAFVDGAVVGFCDTSTVLSDRPGQPLRNMIAAMRTSRPACRGATFLSVRDIKGGGSSCSVMECEWGASLPATEGSGSKWCDGGLMQCVDLSRRLPLPHRRRFTGRLAITGAALTLRHQHIADAPAMASLGDLLSSDLGWNDVATYGAEQATSAEGVQDQLQPLVVTSGQTRALCVDAVVIWLGDVDLAKGFRVDETVSNIARAAAFVSANGATPIVLALPSVTAVAARQNPSALRQRRELADRLRDMRQLHFVDVFRSTSDVVSGLLSDDLDGGHGILNSHGAAVVAHLVAEKLLRVLPSLFVNV